MKSILTFLVVVADFTSAADTINPARKRIVAQAKHKSSKMRRAAVNYLSDADETEYNDPYLGLNSNINNNGKRSLLSMSMSMMSPAELKGMSMSLPTSSDLKTPVVTASTTTTTACDCSSCPTNPPPHSFDNNRNNTTSFGSSNATLPSTPASSATNGTVDSTVTVLKLLTINSRAAQLDEFLGPNFAAFKNNRVRVDVTSVEGFDTLFKEIENDSRLGLELFDLYVAPPVIMGSVVKYNGFADMTSYITDNYLNEWLDIFPGYRDIISTYDGEILMMPFDGDVLHLFYNKEVLSYYNLQPPRTWDEYNIIAETVHGKVFEPTNKTLVGSCIGRVPQCAGAYWAVQVLSSMTQAKGSFEGGLFDTKDMRPLTEEALLETLKIFEKQYKYGNPKEFEGCIAPVNIKSMNEEECVLTYNWGNSFQQDVIRGKLGIAKAPGSKKVLDRQTGKLVPCDKERCPHATYYDDIGFVNHAPYAAFGGWSGAVSANIPPEKQTLAMEFLAFTASKEESRKTVISAAGSRGNDPFRKSHMDVDAFVAAGFDEATTKAYLASIGESLSSPNLVTDIRFPEASKIHGALDTNIINHLNKTKGMEVTDQMRRDVVDSVNTEWAKLINDYDSRGDTESPILKQYQRLRGVFIKENENENLIGNVRWIGYAIGTIVIMLSMALGGWVIVNRKHRVVKNSQPMFLLLVCFGVLVLSSAIFPLGIDESIADPRGCDIACASIPWLLSTGFSVIFAALFSKLWRINRVITAAASMRRIVVTQSDVLLPLACLVTLNFVLLLSWTLVDPLVFQRVYTDELTSYGRCKAEGKAWVGFTSALGVLNFTALILANVQAYMARSINDELSESKYIGLSTLSMLQIFVVGVPLLVIVDTNPSANFFVWTGIIFIVCTSILGLIFVPKVASWRWPTKKVSIRNKWSSYGSAGARPTSKASGPNYSQPLSSGTSEVDKKEKLIPEKKAGRRVSFSDKQSELSYRQKLDDLTSLVLEEHNIDISSIIFKLQDDNKVDSSGTDRKDDTDDVERAGRGIDTA